ncbi:MAG: hypothetical protein U0361_06465 [Nitrospiraceae bacterium]
MAADIANMYVRCSMKHWPEYSLQATERKQAEVEKQLAETRTKLTTARTELANFQKSNKLAKVEEEERVPRRVPPGWKRRSKT